MFVGMIINSAVQRLATSRSRSQPQIGCDCGQDFDQRGAVGGCAPLATNYARGQYIKTTPYFAK